MSCDIGQCQKCSPYTTPLLQKKTPSSLFPSGDRYLATLLASLLSFLSFLPRLHTFTRVSCSYPLLPSSCHPSFLPRPRTLPWCVLLLAILLILPSFHVHALFPGASCSSPRSYPLPPSYLVHTPSSCASYSYPLIVPSCPSRYVRIVRSH